MTPSQLAARLTIHEADTVAPARTPQLRAVGGTLVPPSALRPGLVERADAAFPSLFERESLHRRLLAVADVLSTTLRAAVRPLRARERRPAGPAGARRAPARRADVQGRRALRPRPAPARALDARRGAAARAAGRPLRAGRDDPAAGAARRELCDAVQIAALWLASFFAIVGGRALARWMAARCIPVERCLVIGEPQRAQRIREKLHTSNAHAAVVATLPLVGDEERRREPRGRAPGSCRSCSVDRIIVAPTTTETRGVVELIRIAKAIGVRVSVLPADARGRRLDGRVRRRRRADRARRPPVRPLALLADAQARASTSARPRSGCSRSAPSSRRSRVAIRLDSKGPVFFRQVRVGRDGRHFRIYKFRSMVVDAERAEGRPARPQRGRRRHVQDHRATRASRASATSCAARRSTSCRSCSTCCAAR